jgi:hypothetical protein
MTMRVMALVLLLTLTPCGLPANVVVLLPDENGSVGKVAVHAGTSSAELVKPLAAVNAGSEVSLRNVFTAHRSDVDSEFAGALAATPRAPLVYSLYFQTGSTEVDLGSRQFCCCDRCGKKDRQYRYQRCRSCRRDGIGSLQPGTVSQTRRDRARRPCRSGRSERRHRDYISRSEQSAYTDATGGPRAPQQARRGHHPLISGGAIPSPRRGPFQLDPVMRLSSRAF